VDAIPPFIAYMDWLIIFLTPAKPLMQGPHLVVKKGNFSQQNVCWRYLETQKPALWKRKEAILGKSAFDQE